MMDHLLSLALFLPLAGAALLMLVPASQTRAIKLWANLITALGLLVSILIAMRFNVSAPGYQLVERASWIPSLGAWYVLGIDGISLPLLLLTSLLGFLAILASWSAVETRVKEYYAILLVLQSGMIGVFLALDFFLFFVLFEVTLVPMYFLIGIWGGERRLYAALKFFLYTLAGSVLMLLGGIALYLQHGAQTGIYTFEIAQLLNTQMPLGLERLVFWAFFAGFAVKVPMFPFHTWLPDAHTEAPTAGSVLLAGVLLKMGTYGFLRFSLPLLPNAATDRTLVSILAVLSIIAILYGALVSLVQSDWKRLVAYSSVSHLGFCTLGIFALNQAGLAGSIIQQINHGISTGMLFLIVGVIYERRHSRAIADFGGLAQVMPNFAKVFAIAMFSSAGLPLLNGFIGEFTILQGAFQAHRVWAAFAVAGIVLGAAYLLWLYQRTTLGKISEANRNLPDLNVREWAVFAPLLLLAVGIGVYPKPLFDMVEPPVASILQRLEPARAQAASPTEAPSR
jgi:NADH-quinone oxidoreductase subunit M